MLEHHNFYQNAHVFAKLFSQVYTDPPSHILLQTLQSLKLSEFWPFPQGENINATFELLNCSLNEEIKTLAIKLRDDHMALFIGCGMPLAPLWGSVYLDQENLLQRESTLLLQQFLYKLNLGCTLTKKHPVDNLGICLSALTALLERASTDESQQHVQDMETLLSVHICPWSGRCLELVRQNSKTAFYTAIAALTEELLTGLLHKSGGIAKQHILYY